MMFHRSLTFFLLIGASMVFAEDCSKYSKSGGLLSDLTITCRETIGGEDSEISLDIKLCREKPSITFGIKIDTFHWEETFTDSAEIAIPGLSLPLIGGVYLRVKLEDKPGGKNVLLKMQFFGKTFGIKTLPTTFVNTELEASNCNAVAYWWNSLAGGAQAGCGGGAGLLFILLLVCCCKCCGCCCFKRAPRTTNTIMMNAPQQTNQPSINITNNSSTATQQHMVQPQYMAQPQQNPGGYFVNPMTQPPPAYDMSGNLKYQKL